MPGPDDTVQAYAARFRDGLAGAWESTLDVQMGPGFDSTGLLGSRLEFRSDGTGTLRAWGTVSGDTTEHFAWRSVGPWRVSIRVDDAQCVIDYEFISTPHGVMLRDRAGGEFFWLAHAPLRLAANPW